MSTPLVSVVITTFRRPAFLVAAIGSVLAQDYHEREIIVIDDGSADEMEPVCAPFPVRYFHQENRGPSAARNAGAARARGDLLLFLDDDDLSPSGSLRALVGAWMSGPVSGAVAGRVRRFHEPEPGRVEFIESEREAGHYMSAGAALYPREAFERVRGFDETMRRSEDTDFCLRLKEAGTTFRLIPEICLHYRRHPGNTTHNLDQSDKTMLTALHTAILRRRSQQP
ncbi:MAG: glycosyltransferase [Chthoniobacteraceae bacterium]